MHTREGIKDTKLEESIKAKEKKRKEKPGIKQEKMKNKNNFFDL